MYTQSDMHIGTDITPERRQETLTHTVRLGAHQPEALHKVLC